MALFALQVRPINRWLPGQPTSRQPEPGCCRPTILGRARRPREPGNGGLMRAEPQDRPEAVRPAVATGRGLGQRQSSQAASRRSAILDAANRRFSGSSNAGAVRIGRGQGTLNGPGPPGRCRGWWWALRDVIDTADLPTGYGSPASFADHSAVPPTPTWSRPCARSGGNWCSARRSRPSSPCSSPARTRKPRSIPAGRQGGSSSGSAAGRCGRPGAGRCSETQTSWVGGTARRLLRRLTGFKPSRGWTSTRGIWLLFSEQLDHRRAVRARCAPLTLNAALYRVLRSNAAGKHPAAAASPPARPAHDPPAVGRPSRRRNGPACGPEGPRRASVSVAGRLSDRGWKGHPDGDAGLLAVPCPSTHEVVMAVDVARNLHGRARGPTGADLREAGAGGRRAGRPVHGPRSTFAAPGGQRRGPAACSPPAAVAADPRPWRRVAAGSRARGSCVQTGDPPSCCRPWTLGLGAAGRQRPPRTRRADGLPRRRAAGRAWPGDGPQLSDRPGPWPRRL